jgi:hypothetical protein
MPFPALTLSVGIGLGSIALGFSRDSASVYVVDCEAPTASDANTGTEAAPFKTVQHAADLAKEGDLVLVMTGRYNERVRVKPSGTKDRPIVFRSMPPRTASLGGFELEGSWVKVEGFEITSAKPDVAVQLRGSHCEVLDNCIHHMSVAVAGTVGKPSPVEGTRDYSAVAHNRIAYNQVYHCQYGFMLGGNDWLVENNEVNRLFMYSPGNKFDDCDYSRFFGIGCVQRNNYYHGSISSEIRVAHVDCLQTFTVNGEIAQDLLFEDNTCFDFHQMCMVESAPHLGAVKNWTLKGNIISANATNISAGWGPDIIQTLNVTITGNTISGVRWATIGLRGKESTNGRILNNILCNAERAVIHGDRDFTPANPLMEYNLTFATTPAPGDKNIHGRDPRFKDEKGRNFRLQAGSPAIGAGEAGATIGALEYPNVYYVDPRHPAASDNPGWGYPGVPLASIARASELAQPGETVVLRGGVYRETLRPVHDQVTFRAARNERVTISGADLVTGWKREADGTWSAPMTATPVKVLCDGKPFDQFAYDQASKLLSVKLGDPRLHRFENLVRKTAIDPGKRQNVRIEGIEVENTLP